MDTNEQLEMAFKTLSDVLGKDYMIVHRIVPFLFFMVCIVLCAMALSKLCEDFFLKKKPLTSSLLNSTSNSVKVDKKTTTVPTKNTSNEIILYILETLSSDTFAEDMNVIMRYHDTHKKQAYDQFKKECIENRRCAISNAIKRVHMVYNVVPLTKSLLSDTDIRTLFTTEDIEEYLTYVLTMLEQKDNQNSSDKSILSKHRSFWEKYSINPMI